MVAQPVPLAGNNLRNTGFPEETRDLPISTNTVIQTVRSFQQSGSTYTNAGIYGTSGWQIRPEPQG